MKLVFVSNYMNHHQLPIAKELYARQGDDYAFVQLEPMDQERVNMGWAQELTTLPFMRFYYDEKEKCQSLIDQAEIVILGDEKNPDWIQNRINEKKIVIRYTERLYKDGQWKFISPKGLYHKYHQHTKYRKHPMYLLCAGAYVASDFSLIHAYPKKKFQWGYFPETISYDLDRLLEEKNKEKIEILWTGRMIEWKHPEYPVFLAESLKEDGFDFHLRMIGEGNLAEEIDCLIKEKELEEYITRADFMQPKEVRQYMKKSNIYLFTSDYREGWGAVLNEAMNAGCAVVANVAAGATPTLITHKKSGLVYRNGNYEAFEKHVKNLCQDRNLRELISRNAYRYIVEKWNHKMAASRLLEFCQKILQGKVEPYKEGPLARAVETKQSKMFKEMVEE